MPEETPPTAEIERLDVEPGNSLPAATRVCGTASYTLAGVCALFVLLFAGPSHQNIQACALFGVIWHLLLGVGFTHGLGGAARWGLLISLAAFATIFSAPAWYALRHLGAPHRWPAWSDAGESYLLLAGAGIVFMAGFLTLTHPRVIRDLK